MFRQRARVHRRPRTLSAPCVYPKSRYFSNVVSRFWAGPSPGRPLPKRELPMWPEPDSRTLEIVWKFEFPESVRETVERAVHSYAGLLPPDARRLLVAAVPSAAAKREEGTFPLVVPLEGVPAHGIAFTSSLDELDEREIRCAVVRCFVIMLLREPVSLAADRLSRALASVGFSPDSFLPDFEAARLRDLFTEEVYCALGNLRSAVEADAMTRRIDGPFVPLAQRLPCRE